MDCLKFEKCTVSPLARTRGARRLDVAFGSRRCDARVPFGVDYNMYTRQSFWSYMIIFLRCMISRNLFTSWASSKPSARARSTISTTS